MMKKLDNSWELSSADTKLIYLRREDIIGSERSEEPRRLGTQLYLKKQRRADPQRPPGGPGRGPPTRVKAADRFLEFYPERRPPGATEVK